MVRCVSLSSSDLMSEAQLEGSMNVLIQCSSELPKLRLPNKTMGREDWFDRKSEYQKNLNLMSENLNELMADFAVRTKNQNLLQHLFKVSKN